MLRKASFKGAKKISQSELQKLPLWPEKLGGSGPYPLAYIMFAFGSSLIKLRFHDAVQRSPEILASMETRDFPLLCKSPKIFGLNSLPPPPQLELFSKWLAGFPQCCISCQILACIISDFSNAVSDVRIRNTRISSQVCFSQLTSKN
jgi:hypothetical protein